MENYSIYKDIKDRTNGDIYIGVVGPVRAGKSTFITQFMQNMVVPNIKNRNVRERTIDELPQSAEGRTIMTTQPKFVPNEAVKISVASGNGGDIEMNVRMIDCVGYLIAGAMGHEEGDKPRLVKTPWTDHEMPFEKAAEIGTKKVIDEHSTIGIVLTTDGTISDIPRSNYIEAEERVVRELSETNKPFIILINSREPSSSECLTLKQKLENKYNVPTMAIDATNLTNNDIEQMFEKILLEFPIKVLKVNMPEWMQALPYDNEIISSILNEVRKFSDKITKIGQIDKSAVAFNDSSDFDPVGIDKIKLGDGYVTFKIMPKPHLFYKVLSAQCDTEIKNDFHLINYIRELAHAKKTYERLEDALIQVEQTGYGVVNPRIEDLMLDEPEIVKQGGRFGVKLKASASSLHIMKIDVETEINPLVGTEQQSQDLVTYLNNEFENNLDSIWETNIFGKSLHSLVSDGIKSKIVLMPVEAQRKIRKTLTRIVNEGKGGIICILL
ncbi:MAG: stage IV sporulation protein A [Clostridia bacterium]|nr:stage IV sporulation protein A [Clostridia bacterium]MDD4408764.1 stage IV sporulation protein A [Clostridia bacterium]